MLPLNFNHFYYFYEVARAGSFTAAARELALSQSALSVQIKQLEEAMGGALFDRRKGGVDLTEMGVIAFQSAERVFQDIDRMLAQIRESEQQFHGTVTIGTVNSIGIYLLPPVLSAFKASFPDVRVRIEFREADGVTDLVQTGKVDFAIMPWNRRFADLTGVLLTRNKMFLVGPPGHPLATGQNVSPRELEKYPFVGYAEGMHTRTLMDALMKRMQVSIEYATESTNTATIKHMVMAGMGLGVLPEVAVSEDIRGGQLSRIHVPTLVTAQDIMLYYKTNRSLSASRTHFMNFLHEYFHPTTGKR